MASTDFSKDAYQIGKLTSDGNRYDDWAFKMSCLLRSKDLFDYVLLGPRGDDDKLSDKDHRKNDDKARCTIVLALADDLLSIIRDLNTAKETWDALAHRFNDTSISNMIFVRRKFLNITMNATDTMAAHISNVKNIYDKLKSIGGRVDETDHCLVLLQSLPETYDNMVIALTTGRDLKDLKYVLVTNSLIQEELRRAEQGVSRSAASEGALYSGEAGGRGWRNNGGGGGGGRGRGGRGNGRHCTFCGKNGHDESDCYRKKRCAYCQNPGHDETICRKKQRDIKGASALAARAAQQHAEQANLVPGRHTANTTPSAAGEYALVGNGAPDTVYDVDDDDWIIDSGATSHMTASSIDMSNYRKLAVPISVNGITADKLVAIGVGDVLINTANIHGRATTVTLKGVLHVPGISINLVSVSTLTARGADVNFNKSGCVIKVGDVVIALGSAVDGACKLYKIKTAPAPATPGEVSLPAVVSPPAPTTSADMARRTAADRLHRALGHLSATEMEKVIKHGMLDGVVASKLLIDGKVQLTHCDACEVGKHSRSPFFKSNVATRARNVNELVHSDVSGRLPVKSLAGHEYYVTFTDDFTKYLHVDFMTTKDETLSNAKKYKAAAETAHPGKPLQRFRSDGGGEYDSQAFADFLAQPGIQREFTTAATPEQNGVAESANRILFNKARSMMADAGMLDDVGKPFWAHAVHTAMVMKNVSPTNVLAAGGTPALITPYEAWTGRRPNAALLRRFGCVAYVHVQPRYRDKLDARANKMIFVGYADNYKAFRCFNPVTKKVVVSRDVTFDECANGIDMLKPAAGPPVVADSTGNGVSNAGGQSDHVLISDSDSSSADLDVSGAAVLPPPPVAPAAPVPAAAGDAGGKDGGRSRRPRRAPVPYWDVTEIEVPTVCWW